MGVVLSANVTVLAWNGGCLSQATSRQVKLRMYVCVDDRLLIVMVTATVDDLHQECGPLKGVFWCV